MGLLYSFRGSVHDRRGGKHGYKQADMVLEKELKVLHLDPQKGTVCHTWHSLSIGDLQAHPTVIHFPQPGHTHSNKAIPPNSVPNSFLWAKHSNMSLWGSFLSNHHKSFASVYRGLLQYDSPVHSPQGVPSSSPVAGSGLQSHLI